MIKNLKLLILGLWLLFCLCVALVRVLILPFSKDHNYFFMKLFSIASCAILRIRIVVTGRENISNGDSVVYVMNHQSNYDVILGTSLLLKNTFALGKFEVLFFPFFGAFFYLAGNVLIKRGRKNSISKGVKKIDKLISEKFKSVMIMPEGTRSHGPKMGKFKLGAFKIAIRNQVPIVPIIAESWHQKIDLNNFNSGELRITILPGVETKGLSVEEATDLSSTVREKMLKAMA